jgi:hypothetical protein
MMNHVHMAAPTLTKEIPIESKKIAGIVKPLIRKKSTVAGSWCSASSRVASTTVTLTDYLTVYDSLSLWYGAEVKPPEPRRNRHFLGSQAGGNGFRGLGSSSSQLDAVQSQWGNRLRTGIRALRRLPWRAGGASRKGPTGARFIHRWTHASINRRVQGVGGEILPRCSLASHTNPLEQGFRPGYGGSGLLGEPSMVPSPARARCCCSPSTSGK